MRPDNHSVAAAEYQFADVPETLPVEDVSLRLENKGKELHEFIVMKKKEGVTETFDQILALDRKETESKIEYVGGIGPTEPGDKGYTVVSFEKPGNYLAVCFLPKGVTSMEELQAQEGGPEGNDSPPHFKLGMKKEFKVA